MNKKVSNKIVYLNFILAFLILNLHSAYMELFDTNNTVLVINHKVIFDYLFKSSYMPV